jgi:hypothetical protein
MVGASLSLGERHHLAAAMQRSPVSRRVNSSRADDSDATLIERVEVSAAGVV